MLTYIQQEQFCEFCLEQVFRGIFLTTKCSENKEVKAYLVYCKNCPKKRHKSLDKAGQ